MENIKSKLQNFFKIKNILFFKGVVGWIITSLYSVFFMFVLLGIVLGLCVYYYNSIQTVQPTVKQIRIESNENISWFQFDVFQNASESLEDKVNAGVSFACKYEDKDIKDSIFIYEDVKKKDSVCFHEKRRTVQFRNGYGNLSLLNEEEIPEEIDSTMNYKRHLNFETNEKTLMELEKIDAHVFPDKENRALVDSCSKSKVVVSYYNDVCKDGDLKRALKI